MITVADLKAMLNKLPDDCPLLYALPDGEILVYGYLDGVIQGNFAPATLSGRAVFVPSTFGKKYNAAALFSTLTPAMRLIRAGKGLPDRQE